MARAWMPLYVGDYLADTGHLTTAQHGAYMLLIMHYWQHGCLPSDDATLAQICRLRAKEWAAAKTIVSGFFEEGWKHARIEAELAKAAKIIYAKREASKAGNDARWHNRNIPDGSQMGSHQVSQIDPQSQSQSPITKEVSKKGESAPTAPPPRRGTRLPENFSPDPDWLAAWSAKHQHVDWRTEIEKFKDHWRAATGRNATALDWQAKWRTWAMRAPDYARKSTGNKQNQRDNGWATLAAAELSGDENG